MSTIERLQATLTGRYSIERFLAEHGLDATPVQCDPLHSHAPPEAS